MKTQTKVNSLDDVANSKFFSVVNDSEYYNEAQFMNNPTNEGPSIIHYKSRGINANLFTIT